MVDLKEKKVLLRDQEGEIGAFETWWRVPGGYVHDLDKAIEIIEAMGLPPSCIAPITVAVCTNGLYEPMN